MTEINEGRTSRSVVTNLGVFALLIILVINASGCQTQSREDIRQATPTPSWVVRTHAPTPTPLFRKAKITYDDYGQTLTMYVGDTFTIDIPADILQPVAFDTQILQQVIDPTLALSNQQKYKAIHAGNTTMSVEVDYPCHNAPIGCSGPFNQTMIEVNVQTQ